MFIRTPDRSVELTVSGADVKRCWAEINESLWKHFQGLSPAQWLEGHKSVTETEFARQPHRNRYNVLLGRTAHMAEHIGQAVLAEPRK